jgi:hypothetical protein
VNPADWSVEDWMIVLFLFSVVAVPLIIQVVRRHRIQRRAMLDNGPRGFDVIPSTSERDRRSESSYTSRP